MVLKPCISLCVPLGLPDLLMRWPIYFHAQSRRGTIEIENVDAHWVLTAKAQSELISPQHRP
jgi:hypothetical protein